jgi:photosystem II stability/assembly factor-like uncharacterized protein
MKRIFLGLKKRVMTLGILLMMLSLPNSAVYAGWASISSPYISPWWLLKSVHFTSASEGWAVGTDGTNKKGILLHYSSGSWTPVTPPDINTPPDTNPSWELTSVHFTSSDEGWAVETDAVNRRGVLLYYLNGIWTVITPPDVSQKWLLTGVHFTSPDEG